MTTRICKNLCDLSTDSTSKKVTGALLSFYAVRDLPGLWVCVRTCRADTIPGPGQVVATREYLTGTLMGHFLLERLDNISNAVTTGSW